MSAQLEHGVNAQGFGGATDAARLREKTRCMREWVHKLRWRWHGLGGAPYHVFPATYRRGIKAESMERGA